ncbi:hypothetical protein [Rhodanobacter sp. OR87]|uniref:hypothetical protein n=1 Tax=Rhodanobacter sp. OR87 TaxID=1076523 RepID=UPI0004885959|nr:hypothetical protein [Rhodanobacter sp. OR87]
MTTVDEFLSIMTAGAARQERRRQRMQPIRSGKVLSLMRANGEWLAIVAAFTSKRDEPVLSKIVPIVDLKGSARRKADRWVKELS